MADTNLILRKRLTFSAAMSMIWFLLSTALYLSVGLLKGWFHGGQIVSSTATVRKNASDDIVSVSRLELTYSNATVTWEKRHVT